MSNTGRFPMVPHSNVCPDVLCPQIHVTGQETKTRDWLSCLRLCVTNGCVVLKDIRHLAQCSFTCLTQLHHRAQLLHLAASLIEKETT